jgi:hypothetical protein
LLYDFFNSSGSVNEDVFAYSNRTGGERALVVYHNRYGSAHGTIDFSAAYADKGSGQQRQRRIAEGLGLSGDRDAVIAWRDSITDLKYLRRARDLFDRGLTLDLRAYQYHVFLDWHELHPTAEKPWDRLADLLNGRGVSSLDDELVNLELQPVHDALRWFLDPGLVRNFADVADGGTSQAGGARAAGAERAKKIERQRAEFLNDAHARAEALLHVVQDAYAACLRQAGEPAPSGEQVDAALRGQTFNKLLRAAMQIPAVEALSPAPWTAGACRVLPSPSAQLTTTEMWGSVLAWCALTWLAETIDAAQPERIALDLFDRLRLRQPFGHAFAALGFQGEEPWRVAARIKVLLLTGAGAGKPQASAPVSSPPVPAASTQRKATESSPAANKSGAGKSASPLPQPEQEQVALAPALWLDPDVRWLCGVHEAEGHLYLIREQYEELLWWLQLPALLRLAGEAAPSRAAVEELSKTVAAALDLAEAAGYRVDKPLAAAEAGEISAPEPAAPAASTPRSRKDRRQRTRGPAKSKS